MACTLIVVFWAQEDAGGDDAPGCPARHRAVLQRASRRDAALHQSAWLTPEGYFYALRLEDMDVASKKFATGIKVLKATWPRRFSLDALT